jgi:xylulokinase
MELLLGIDLGTGGCKVNIIDANGRWICSGSSEYQTFHQHPNWSEQNPEDWYAAFKRAFSEAITSGGVDVEKIAAVGVDASTHNAVLLDSDMKVLRNCIMWTDQRSTEEVKWLNDNFGQELFDITYQQVSPTWTLPQLLWIQRHEEHVFNKIHRICFTKDYLRYCLTKSWGTDHIDAQGSMLWDMKDKCWSERICDIASIPQKTLPPLKSPCDIAGGIIKKVAAETGLKAGTPVIVGSSDTATESYGVGILEAGQCVVKMATAGTVSIFTDMPQPSPKSLTYSSVIPELWYACMGTNSAAESMRWFRDVLSKNEVERSKQEQITAYEIIDEAAATSPPGAKGLIFHPYLMGERSPYWDSNLRASFTGISAYHHKGHFSRAVMEGVAYSLKDCALALEELGLTMEEVRFIGGGAKSKLWTQILADVLNKRVVRLECDDASYGAAMLAGVGTGIFSNMHEAVQKCVRVVDTITPNVKNVGTYTNYFSIYRKIHDDLEDTYAKLIEVQTNGSMTE